MNTQKDHIHLQRLSICVAGKVVTARTDYTATTLDAWMRMMHKHEAFLPPSRGAPEPNTASTGRRLKRNVRIGDRRTTIVPEAYVWDSIDSMLQRKVVSLDEFCNRVEDTRKKSSMASSARLVVLIYFRLLGQINSPPFVDDDLERLRQEDRLWAPAPADPPIPLLPFALKRFAQDEAHVA